MGTQALPLGKMDLSSSTTQRDLGQFHSTHSYSNVEGTQIKTRLSATNIGTNAIPNRPMDLSGSTTQNDLGQFNNNRNNRNAIFNNNANEAAQMKRKLSATNVSTNALPSGKMDLSGSTTQRDIGRFEASTPESASNSKMSNNYSVRRRLSSTNVGTQALPHGNMDLSGSTTQRDLGLFYSQW